ncbi:hypothetical protein [Brochothrix phage ADU4]|nr:hypothetical protein [Brochothrix phage ADU4]
MLDLKLKAWCYELGEFVCIKYLEFIDEDISYMHAQDKNGEDIEPPYASERLGIDWELLHYTGKADENDDSIYNGYLLEVTVPEEAIPIRSYDGSISGYDFIEGYSQIGVVNYVTGEYYYDTVRTISGAHHDISVPLTSLTRCKIMGNIYENPELLGAEAYW